MAGRAPKRRKPKSEVSCIIKYLVFGFNVFFWGGFAIFCAASTSGSILAFKSDVISWTGVGQTELKVKRNLPVVGGSIIAVGMWAWTEKGTFDNFGELTGTKWLDPVVFILVVGLIIFFIGFFGCIGALRENTILLLLYICAIGLILLMEIVICILAFAYKDWLKDQISKELLVIIEVYRDDADLQNLIDWVQADWLKCCGISDYNDWDANVYFNCTSPSVEACGVPFSCCVEDEEAELINTQCGYEVRSEAYTSSPEEYIYTTGCVQGGEDWLNNNLVPVAAVGVSVAVLQIVSMILGFKLRGAVENDQERGLYNVKK